MPTATTLPSRYYTDSDLFREELERFFANDWICAGAPIKSRRRATTFFARSWVKASSLLVTGATHCKRFSMSVGIVELVSVRRPQGHFPGRIQCGYHGWTYGLDGGLIGAPHAHDGFCREDYPLNRDRCRRLGRAHLHQLKREIMIRSQLN